MSQFFLPKKKFRNIFGSEKNETDATEVQRDEKKSEYFSPELLFRNKKKIGESFGAWKCLFFENGDERSLVVSFKPVFDLRNGYTEAIFLLGL